MDSVGDAGLDRLKEDIPHRPKMLAFSTGGRMVVAVDTVYRLGAETLRDGAGLCAGVL